MGSNIEKGLSFEKKCFNKLAEIGFQELKLTNINDNGADIVGVYKGTRYVFQCKDHKKTQGNSCVQEVVAAQKLYKAHRSVVISCSSFTPAATALAAANSCILIESSTFFDLSDFPPQNYSNYFQVKNQEYYISDYNIVEQYEEEKRRIGRQPKWNELDKHLRYRIKKDYRNFGNFLSALGESKNSIKPSDEELKTEYLRIKALVGKVPSLSDIKKYSAFSLNSFHTYPFTKLQRECGDRPNVERGVSKEDLVDAYFALKENLGHYPSIKEIDERGKYRASYYRRRWGSIDGFLKDIGKSRTEAGLNRVYSKEEIIVVYSLIKILLSIVKESDSYTINHSVLEKLMYDEAPLISPSTISNKFTTWASFTGYRQQNNIDENVDRIIQTLKKGGFDVLLKIPEDKSV